MYTFATKTHLEALGFIRVPGTSTLWRDPRFPDLLFKEVTTLDQAVGCGGVMARTPTTPAIAWLAAGAYAQAFRAGEVPLYGIPTTARAAGLSRKLARLNRQATTVMYTYSANVISMPGAFALVSSAADTVLVGVVTKLHGCLFATDAPPTNPRGLAALVSNSDQSATASTTTEFGTAPYVTPNTLRGYKVNGHLYVDVELMSDFQSFIRGSDAIARFSAEVPADILEHYLTAYASVSALEKWKRPATIRLVFAPPRVPSTGVTVTGTTRHPLRLLTRPAFSFWVNPTGTGIPGAMNVEVKQAAASGQATGLRDFTEQMVSASVNQAFNPPVYGVPPLLDDFSGALANGGFPAMDETAPFAGRLPFKRVEISKGRFVRAEDFFGPCFPYVASLGTYSVEDLDLEALIRGYFDYIAGLWDISDSVAPAPSDPLQLDSAVADLELAASGQLQVDERFLSSTSSMGSFLGLVYQFCEEVAMTARSASPEVAKEIGWEPPSLSGMNAFTLSAAGSRRYNDTTIFGGTTPFAVLKNGAFKRLDQWVTEDALGVVGGNSAAIDFESWPGMVPIGAPGTEAYYRVGDDVYRTERYMTAETFPKPQLRRVLIGSFPAQGLEWPMRLGDEDILYRQTFPTATTTELRRHVIVGGVPDTGVVITGERMISGTANRILTVNTSGIKVRDGGNAVLYELAYSLTGVLTVSASGFTVSAVDRPAGVKTITIGAAIYAFAGTQFLRVDQAPDAITSSGAWKISASGGALIGLSGQQSVTALVPTEPVNALAEG